MADMNKVSKIWKSMKSDVLFNVTYKNGEETFYHIENFKRIKDKNKTNREIFELLKKQYPEMLI